MTNRTHRRKALNNVPDITFFGTELDRALNGGMTEALRRELVKDAKALMEESHFDLPGSNRLTGPTPFEPKGEAPLVVVMMENICKCGSTSITYGYHAHIIIEQVGNGEAITRFQFVPKPLGKPQHIKYEEHRVPFCHSCIPNGLNLIK